MNDLRLTETKRQVFLVRDISTDPGPFCMSFGFDSASSTNSMKQMGLLNSPLLLHTKSGLEIVTGFQRILAARFLGWSHISCRVLNERESTGLECFLINLHDNLTVRCFNDIEKGMILSRASRWIQKDDLIRTYLPLLGLPQRETTLGLYLHLDQTLENDIKESLVKGEVSLHTVGTLIEMDTESRLSIYHAITRLGLNQNQQKNFIAWLLDISHHRNQSLSGILGQDKLQWIFDDKMMNAPQKATAVLKELWEELFPRLSRAEKSFYERVAAIRPPKDIRITFPPHFEAPLYQMAVSFKNGKDLLDKLKEMVARENALLKLGDPGEET